MSSRTHVSRLGAASQRQLSSCCVHAHTENSSATGNPRGRKPAARYVRNVYGLAAGLVVLVGAMPPAFAQTATRDLSEYTGPGVAFVVAITIDGAEGTAAMGAEDAPPDGWQAANISHGGTWDAENSKVKWGPLFAPSIPDMMTYQVTPPSEAAGERCFSGIASFDGLNSAIEGDACVSTSIPALSPQGFYLLAMSLAAAGAIVLRRRFSRTES